MKTLSRVSVAVSYPFLTLLLVMGVFVLIGFLALRGTRETSSDLMVRLTDQATERMRQYVLSTLNAPIRIGDFNAQLLGDGIMDIQTPEGLSGQVQFLASQLRSWKGVSAILLCNKNDEVVWVERGPNGEFTLHESFNRHDDFCIEWNIDADGRKASGEIGRYPYVSSQRPWHLQAMESEDGVGWTPLYSWANSQVGGVVGSGRSVRVTSPEGEFLGVVDVGFTVNALSQLLEQIDISPNGQVFIMDSSGMLVAASKVKDSSAGTTGVLASNSTDLEIGKAARALELAQIQHRVGGRLTRGPGSSRDAAGFLHASFSHDGEVYQVDSEKLDAADGPEWTLVTILPESDILAGVNVVQRRLVYSALVVLVLAGVFAIILARSITNPIIALRRSASEIASGDLDERFTSRGGLEFSQLSEALDRMTRGLRERLEMRTALAVAMEVQQNLLPQSFPSSTRLDIAGASVFSDETGGDYFDFPMHSEGVEISADGSVTIAVGDVTGHGIGAALIMAAARSALRTSLKDVLPLGELLSEVNNVLFGDVPNGRFMTLLMMRLSADGRNVEWASAGHDPPIIYSPANDSFTEPSGGGVPLAILAGETYDQYDLVLDEGGEIIFTATDGVWETANGEKELFGKERLMDVLRDAKDLDSESIIKCVVSALNEFRGSERPADDVTMVVVKRLS